MSIYLISVSSYGRFGSGCNMCFPNMSWKTFHLHPSEKYFEPKGQVQLSVTNCKFVIAEFDAGSVQCR